MFLVNVIYTWRRAQPAPADPWDGRSLEWSLPSPPPEYNFAEIPVVEARDDWWHRKYTEDADGRLVRLPSGGADVEPTSSGGSEVAVAAAPGAPAPAESHGADHDIHLPSPSFYPMILALGLPCLGYAAVFREALWLIPGLILLLFGIFAWGLEPSTEEG
jgi:cytochrome c oxidase subunit 1